MNKRITFAQFDGVLEELGFKKTIIPTSHVNYRHEASDTLLMIRLHQPDDFVPEYVMASTQLQLDGRGVIGAAEFEDRFRSTAA